MSTARFVATARRRAWCLSCKRAQICTRRSATSSTKRSSTSCSARRPTIRSEERRVRNRTAARPAGQSGRRHTSWTGDWGSDVCSSDLYPLSAFRAMSKAAFDVYGAIRRDGTQKSVVPLMQTRADLYETLGYIEYEKKLDELFGASTDDKIGRATRTESDGGSASRTERKTAYELDG